MITKCLGKRNSTRDIIAARMDERERVQTVIHRGLALLVKMETPSPSAKGMSFNATI